MHDQFEHCAGVVRDRDRDRYLATLFAPEEVRGALFALYAFGAEIARIRDLSREPIPGEIRLQWWREVLLGERSGEAAANPVAAALLETIARYNISRERLVGLIEAYRFDIYNEPMASVAEFQSYASKTDGMIFDMAAHILDGGIGPVVAPLAAEAGSAQTIVNMLALLPRHSARGQLYLPLEMLRHYGAAAEDVFALRATTELRAVLAEFRLRARRHLNRIGEAIDEIPTRAQVAFLPLAPLRLWLLAMERPDYDPFRPPEIAPWRRQWRIWRAARSPQRIGK
jgi:15-cis-phytoene synthase